MSTNTWLLWTMLALFAYGLWGIFNAFSSKYSDPFTGIFLSSLGHLISGIIAMHLVGFKLNIEYKSVLSGLSLGLATGLGGLFLLLSLNKGGNINNVIAITAIYPLATLLFSFVMLNERFSLQQFLGIIFSIIAVILLTTNNK